MKKRIIKSIFCMILLSMSIQSVSVKANLDSLVINTVGDPQMEVDAVSLQSISSTSVDQRTSTEMVYVPAGEFQMGCDPEHSGGYGCRYLEVPIHTVYLNSFYIDKTEITNYKYSLCVAADACDPPSNYSSSTRNSYYDNPDYSNYPVIYVDWFNAKDYCSWVGKRLPTEAEWEKTARGTLVKAFPWGDEDPSCNLANTFIINTYTSCVGDTSEVGSYPSGVSPYGALDMAGNVFEWVNDWYSDSYYIESPYFNPIGPINGDYRVTRGGSWASFSYYIVVSKRDFWSPEYLEKDLGFRCVSDSDLSEPSGVDLDVSDSSVTLADTQYQLKENQPAVTVLETTVTNHGPDPTTNLVVEFHDGFPSVDTLITSKTFDSTINSGDSAVIQMDWQTQPGSTEANIYVKVSTSDNDTNLLNNLSSEGTPALAAFADFSYNPDTFSFSNNNIDKLTFFDGLLAYSNILDLTLLRFIYRKIIVPSLFFIFGDGGHCYGMSTASIIYWDTPLVKPVAIDTYLMDWETNEVASDIEAMHFRQILGNGKIELLSSLFPSLVRPATAYNKIKERLIKDYSEPSVLSLWEDIPPGKLKSDWMHAVTAYKIIEIDDKKYVNIYDNRYPLTFGYSDIILLDEESNIFHLYTDEGIVRTIPTAIATKPKRSPSEITAESLEDIIDAVLSLLGEKELLQGYFEWDVSDLLSSPDFDSDSNQEVEPTSEIPAHFLILDSSGNKLGYNHGVFVNEISGSEFVEFDSAFYWLLPADGTYSIETVGNGTTNATFSLAIPQNTSFVQTTIYDGFGIPQDALATTSFSQSTTDWRIEIEGQDDVLPVVDEEIEVEGIFNVFLPLIMKK